MAKWQKGQSGNPKGRPPKVRKDVGRWDGWANVLTGLGTSRDKRIGAGFIADIVDDQTARELWIGNDIAARIIEALPQEMLRAGWSIQVKTEDEQSAPDALELSEEMTALFEDMEIEGHVERALQYERAYGGAAIFPILNDGQKDLEKPLNLDGIINLSHFVVLEPRECLPETWQGDLTKPGYAEPELYRVAPISRGQVAPTSIIVHRSRLLIFPGIRVSRQLLPATILGWGGSILSRVNGVLRDFGVAWDSVAAILQDFSQAVYKFVGLADILAQDDKQVFAKRIEAMELARSVLRAVVLDSAEEFERKQTPITGVPELLDKFATRLAAAADMPVTLLMGVSPAGLNATGESDRAFFYDRVQRMQQIKLRPRLEWLIKLLFAAKSLGPEKEFALDQPEPDVWSIQFNPLWEPSAKERAETRYQIAQADGIYLDRGVLLPEEVALSRFGGDEYSEQMQIETETREKVLELSQKQMLDEAQNPQPEPQPNGAPNGKAQAQQGSQEGANSKAAAKSTTAPVRP